MMDPRRWLFVAFACVYFFWGTTYLGIRIAIETLPPFLMGSLRFILAAASYCLFLTATRRWRGLTVPQAFHAGVAGVLMLAGGNGAVTWAEQSVPSGITSLLIGTTPFWIIWFDWRFRRTRPPLRSHWAGVAVGLAGMALLVAPERWIGEGRTDLHGAAVLLLASVLWSAGSVYARAKPGPPDPATAACIQMGAGSVALLLMSWLRGETAGFSFAAVSARSWAALSYLLVGGSLIGYTGWVYILKHSTAARAATPTYVNPLVAVFLGWLIGGEVFSLRLWVAAPVILAAVYLMSKHVDVKEEGSVA